MEARQAAAVGAQKVAEQDYAGAADAARDGLREAPDQPQLLALLALAEDRLGRGAQAEEAARKLLRGNPGDIDAQCMLAQILIRRGELAEATELYDRARAVAPDAPAVVDTGERLKAGRAARQVRPAVVGGALAVGVVLVVLFAVVGLAAVAVIAGMIAVGVAVTELIAPGRLGRS